MHTKSNNINEAITSEFYDQTRLQTRQFLANFFSRIKLWNERIVSRPRLTRIDDHLLRDVGFSQNYVEEQTNKPFWVA
jgi:uncharacterized protein YjiS (DUF1127 family)